MKIKDALLKYVNEKEKDKHQRKTGVYWASDIWQIEKGYITPENYFEERLVDLKGAENILFGNALEKEWSEIFKFSNLDFKYQPRKEIEITEDIKLVVKPDFVFKNLIIEMKCPDKEMPNIIPDKWIYQLCAEALAFKLPVWLGILRKHPAITLIPYQPSKATESRIVEILMEFDKKLRSKSSTL